MRCALLAIFLAGCFPIAGDDGTQTGTEVPDYCAENGRSVVDPEVVVESLGFAPAEVIAEATGSFSGPFTPVYGDASTVALSLARSGDVELVTFTLVTRFVEEGDPVSDGAPDEPMACAAKLAIPVAGTLATADGAFDEALSATLGATSATDGTLTTSIPLADVQGTARPTAFTQTWPNQALAVDATFAGAWIGTLTWQGSTDEPTEDFDTDGTGTVEPSGESETAGSFETAR